jgi:propionyl-CoA carboxylase alpha chain
VEHRLFILVISLEDKAAFFNFSSGYGFLSENSHFVKALDEAGVTFIGPNEKSMYDMGDKIQSKIIAKKAGVNIIPGYEGVVKNVEHAISIGKYVPGIRS